MKAKTKTELNTLLADVAAALGGTFNNNYEGDKCGWITLADGVRFFVVADHRWSRGKICVESAWPRYQRRANGDMYNMSQRDFSDDSFFDGIIVSHNKTAAQIARDIERRFLPEYRPLWAKAIAYVQQQADYWKNYNALEAVATEVLKPAKQSL